METLEILADPLLAQAVRDGLDDVEEERLVSHEELWGEAEAGCGWRS